MSNLVSFFNRPTRLLLRKENRVRPSVLYKYIFNNNHDNNMEISCIMLRRQTEIRFRYCFDKSCLRNAKTWSQFRKLILRTYFVCNMSAVIIIVDCVVFLFYNGTPLQTLSIHIMLRVYVKHTHTTTTDNVRTYDSYDIHALQLLLLMINKPLNCLSFHQQVMRRNWIMSRLII